MDPWTSQEIPGDPHAPETDWRSLEISGDPQSTAIVRALQDLTGPCNSVCAKIKEHMGTLAQLEGPSTSRRLLRITTRQQDESTLLRSAKKSKNRLSTTALHCLALLPASTCKTLNGRLVYRKSQCRVERDTWVTRTTLVALVIPLSSYVYFNQ